MQSTEEDADVTVQVDMNKVLLRVREDRDTLRYQNDMLRVALEEMNAREVQMMARIAELEDGNRGS